MFVSRLKVLPTVFSFALTSSCSPSLIGCSMRGSRWSSTPDRSPNSQTSRSSLPVSHNPARLDTPPPCRPPPPPPQRSSSQPQRRNIRLRPLHTPDTRPELNTWTASRRTDRPGDSERNSLHRDNQNRWQKYFASKITIVSTNYNFTV